jgi:hypothetical protein
LALVASLVVLRNEIKQQVVDITWDTAILAGVIFSVFSTLFVVRDS